MMIMINMIDPTTREAIVADRHARDPPEGETRGKVASEPSILIKLMIDRPMS
jgi:hypothetical protein